MASEIITRTVYGAGLQNALLLRRPYTILPNSTLNQALAIQHPSTIAAGVYPQVGYYAIGRKGTRRLNHTESGVGYDAPVKHRPRDAGPFEIVPFVLRLITDDLPEVERNKYALRRQEEHGGLQYYAYYLKRLDLSNTTIDYSLTTVVGGVENSVPFVPNSGDLSPTQPVLPPSTSTPALEDGDFLEVSSPVPVVFSAQDVQEYYNVCSVLYGDPLFSVVSEIAVCSGLDRVVNVQTTGGATIPFNEAVGVQITHFISTYYSLAFVSTGFDMTFDIGATEPMLIEE